MAPAAKANYKTFEAQARLIRAIIAAHPEVKWNYKDIVACYGSDMTEAALNHRFRRVRAEAVIITEGRKQGLDMKEMKLNDELPKTQGEVDKQNISKYFGQSTADGIQFQFRSIKKDADRIRQVADEGGDVASLPLAGVSGGPSVLSTPTKASPTKGTPSKSGGRKRKAPIVKDETAVDDSDPEVASVHDWSDVGDVGTPTKKTTASAKRAKTTPSAASSLAPATTYNDEIVKADPETELAEIASIFGNPTPSAGRSSNTPADNGYGSYPSYAGYGDEI